MKIKAGAGLLKRVCNNRISILSKAVTYFVLIGIGFVCIYPMIYMLVCSFMSADDLVDPSITWVPTGISFENFISAFKFAYNRSSYGAFSNGVRRVGRLRSCTV